MHNLKEVRKNFESFKESLKKRSVNVDFSKFLFSINLTEKIDNSYKINKGIANPIWVIGSGGVNNAAAANIITTTYFLLFFKKSESTNPTLANKLKTTGSWKLIPNAKINFITKDRYSFTLASNCIGKLVEIPELSNERKNLIARGIIR